MMSFMKYEGSKKDKCYSQLKVFISIYSPLLVYCDDVLLLQKYDKLLNYHVVITQLEMTVIEYNSLK